MKKGFNIYKRKDGRFEARYIKGYDENNKRKYGYIYAKSYKEARAKLLKINNVIPSIENNNNYGIIINIIADNWLNTAKIKVKKSTYTKYYYTVTNHIKQDLGNMPMNSLTNTALTAYTNTLLTKNSKGKTLKSKTVKDILNILGMIIRYYKKNYNPSFNVEIVYPRVEKKKIDVLSDIEIEALETHICNEPDLKKLGILLTLYTGLRVGEICSLRWEDINLFDGYMTINRTIQRMKDLERNDGSKTIIVIDTPKSQSSIRQIPLPDFIIPILYKYQNVPRSYFLTGENGYIEPRTYQNYFKKCLTQSNIRNTNFHTLRHTFATRCIKNNCDVKSLSEILGHSDVKTTLELYVHPDFEMKKANINKVSPIVLPLAV